MDYLQSPLCDIEGSIDDNAKQIARHDDNDATGHDEDAAADKTARSDCLVLSYHENKFSLCTTMLLS
jgi:hypothetical protein